MLATLLATLALTQPCPGGICPPQFVPRTPVAEAPHPAVVRISNDNGRERSLGSGTLVAKSADQGLILSCAHLFREYTGNIVVTFPDGEAFTARLIQRDPSVDLSALAIALPSAPVVTVAPQAPRAGDMLVSCGYGPHGQFATNRGRALGYVTFDGRTRDVLELTGAARQGDSGGPVFNAQGQLAGVLFGTDGRTVDATHCLRVEKFLHTLRRNFGPGTRDAGTRPPVPRPPKSEPPIPESPPARPEPPQRPDAATPIVESRLAQLERAQEQLQSQLAAALHKPGAPCHCDPSLPDRIAQLEASRPAPATAGDPPPRASADAACSGSGQSWALGLFLQSKLTAVLVGLGLPGGAAALATWLVARRLKRKLRAIVIHDQTPPPPQVIERERQFVEVQVPTDRLGALEWAMDEYVKRNPGARPTIETIEAYAKQFQSATKH